MHVFGGFNQRHKTSNKPRALEDHKVSFVGCSLAFGSSFTLDTSIFPMSCPVTTRPTYCPSEGGGSQIRPAFPPLRLHERRLISSPTRHPSHATCCHHNVTADDEHRGYSLSCFDDDNTDPGVEEQDLLDHHPAGNKFSLGCRRPVDLGNKDNEDAQGCIFLQIAQRQLKPRSRWRQSNIRALGPRKPEVSDAATHRGNIAYEIAFVEQARLVLPGFSDTDTPVPKRLQLQAVDSVELLIKRGGLQRFVVRR